MVTLHEGRLGVLSLQMLVTINVDIFSYTDAENLTQNGRDFLCLVLI